MTSHTIPIHMLPATDTVGGPAGLFSDRCWEVDGIGALKRSNRFGVAAVGHDSGYRPSLTPAHVWT